MNKQYKLKFNNVTRSLDAVSELATNAISHQKTTKASPSSLTSSEVKLERNLSPKKMITATMVAVLGMGATLAQANANSESLRSGMNVVAGSAAVDVQGTLTQITTKGNTILNWQKFGINSNEVLKFIQESSNNAVLNRVLGGQVSQILGQLQSNGKVFIVNPAGIVFGQGSSVDVNSLVASTLDISNDDFLKGKYVFNQEKDQALASVINAGMIKVQDNGTLALIGGKAVNRGVLEASNGAVYLLAGKSITIQDLDNPLVSYKVSAGNKAVNLGSIIANKATLLANKVANGYTTNSAFSDVISVSDSATKAQISATGEVTLVGAGVSDTTLTTNANDATVAAALANTAQAERGLTVVNGTLVADNATGKAGIIKVLGDQVKLESQAQVSATGVTGGQVFIGGDTRGQGDLQLAGLTQLTDTVVINVSGQENAGNITVWGNHADFAGSLKAQAVEGNGGFIETSGRTFTWADSTRVNTLSVKGKIGTWLLDPDVINVSQTKGTGTSDLSTDDLKTQLKTTGANIEANKLVKFDSVTIEESDEIKGDLNVTISQKSDQANAIQFTNTKITTKGEINFKGPSGTPKANNISLSNSQLTGKLITVDANNVSLTSNGERSLFKATEGTVSLNVNGLTLDKGAIISNASLVLASANYAFRNDSCVTVTSGSFTTNINLDSNTLTFKNTNFTAASGITVAISNTQHNKKLNIEDSQLTVNGNGNFNITATPTGGSTVTPVNSNINVTNVTVTALNGEAKFSTEGKIFNLNNVSVTAKTARMENYVNKFFISNSHINATSTDSSKEGITITSLRDINTQYGLINVSNTSLTTPAKIKLYSGSNKDDSSLNLANLTAQGYEIAVVTGIGNKNAGTTSISVLDNVALTATNKIDLSVHNAITANNLTLNATSGDLILNLDGYYTEKNTTKSSSLTDVAAYAGKNVEINSGKYNSIYKNLNVTAENDITLQGMGYIANTKQEFADSKFNAQSGNVKLTTSQGNTVSSVFNNVAITASKDITGSVNSNLLFNNASTLTAGANVSLTLSGAAKFITIENATTSSAASGAETTETATKQTAIKAEQNIQLHAPNITVTNSALTTTSGEVSLGNASTVNLTVTGATLTSTNNDVNLRSNHNYSLTASKLSAGQDINISLPGQAITLQDNQKNSYNYQRTFNITAKTITLDSFTIEQPGTFSAKADESLTVKASTLNATANNVNLEAATLDVQNGVKINANKDVTYSGTTSATFTGVNVTATGKIEGRAAALTLTNSNFSGTTGTIVDATAATISGGRYASQGDTIVNATTVAVKGSAKLEGKNNLQLGNATTTSVIVNESASLESTAGNISITALTTVDIKSVSKLSAAKDLNITNPNADINLDDFLPTDYTVGRSLNITANNITLTSADKIKPTIGNLGLNAKNNLTINANAKLVAGVDLTLTAANTLKVADNANTTATGSVNLGAKDIFLTTSKEIKAGNALTATASNNLTVDSTPFSATNGLTLSGSNVTINGPTTTTSTSGAVAITAEQNLKIDQLTAAAATGISAVATNGNTTITNVKLETKAGTAKVAAGKETRLTGSNLTTESGIATVKGASVVLTNSNISGTTVINVTATTSKIIAEQSTFNGGTEGGVNFKVNADTYQDTLDTPQTLDSTITLTGVQVKGANFSASAAKVSIDGDATEIKTSGDLEIEGRTREVSILNGKVESTAGNVEVSAAADLTIKDANVTANKQVTLSGTTITTQNANISGITGIALTASTGDIKTTGSLLEARDEDVTINAIKGKADVTGTNISAGSQISITGAKGVDATGANISGLQGIVLLATETNANIKATETNLSAASGSVSAVALDGTIDLKDSNVTSGKLGSVTLGAAKGIDITNANISGYGGVAATTAQGDIKATGVNVTAQAGDVSLITKDGAVNVSRSNITAGQPSKVNFEATTGIDMTNANISGYGGVTATTTKGDVKASGANVTAQAGDVSLVTKDGAIDVSRSNITAGNPGKVNLEATTGIDMTNANISGYGGITATTTKGDVKASGANVTAQAGDVSLVTKDGAIDVSRSNITAGQPGKVNLEATTGIDMTHANISGYGGVTATTEKGDVRASGANVTAQAGDVSLVTKDGAVDVSRSNITAGNPGKVNLEATTGIDMTNANISGYGGITATTTKGDIKATGANVTAQAGDVSLVTKDGAIDVSRSNITAGEPGKVSIEATKGITLDNSNISGYNGVSLNTTEGDITAKDSKVVTKAGNIDLKAGNGNITSGNTLFDAREGNFTATAKQNIDLGNGTIILAKNRVDLTVSDGNVSIVGTNVTAPTAQMNVTAGQNITLNNSNLTVASLNLKAVGAITAKDTSVNATGNISLSSTSDVYLFDNSTLNAPLVIVDSAKEPTLLNADFKSTYPQKRLYLTKLGSLVNFNAAAESLLSQYLSSGQYLNELSDQESNELRKSLEQAEQTVEDDASRKMATGVINVQQLTTSTFEVCMLNVSAYIVKYQITTEDLQNLGANEIVTKYKFTSEDASSYLFGCKTLGMEAQSQNLDK